MKETSLVQAAVGLTLEGREHELRFSAYAFIRYAEETKGDLLADIAELGNRITAMQKLTVAIGEGGEPSAEPRESITGPMFAKMRDVVWAGLLDREEGVTRDQVARMIHFGAIFDVMTAVTQAIRLTMPQETSARPPRAARPPKRRDGAMIDGSGSGPSSETVQELPPASSAA